MHVLVTGGTGFIGGNLAEAFARDGHDVTVLDNFDPYYDTGTKQRNVEIAREASAEGDGSYEFVDGDVRNAAIVDEVVDAADVIYHQAAQAGVRTSVDDPRKPNEITVDGTLNVLDAARETDIKRVVLASSSSVYGKPEYLPYDEEPPTTPSVPMESRNSPASSTPASTTRCTGYRRSRCGTSPSTARECARTWRSRTSSLGV